MRNNSATAHNAHRQNLWNLRRTIVRICLWSKQNTLIVFLLCRVVYKYKSEIPCNWFMVTNLRKQGRHWELWFALPLSMQMVHTPHIQPLINHLHEYFCHLYHLLFILELNALREQNLYFSQCFPSTKMTTSALYLHYLSAWFNWIHVSYGYRCSPGNVVSLSGVNWKSDISQRTKFNNGLINMIIAWIIR